MLGHWFMMTFIHFGKKFGSLFKNLVGVFNFEGLVVNGSGRQFRENLCSVENGMLNSPLVFSEPRSPAEIWDVCLDFRESSQNGTWFPYSCCFFFREYEKYSWIWDCQKHIIYLYWKAMQLPVASDKYTAKLEAREHHVAVLLTKGGESRVDENRWNVSLYHEKHLPSDHWAILTISTTNALCWAT